MNSVVSSITHKENNMKVIKISKLKGDGHCYLKPEWLLEDGSGPITDFLNHADIGEKIQLEVLNLTDLQFYKAVMKQAVTDFDEQWADLMNAPVDGVLTNKDMVKECSQ